MKLDLLENQKDVSVIGKGKGRGHIDSPSGTVRRPRCLSWERILQTEDSDLPETAQGPLTLSLLCPHRNESTESPETAPAGAPSGEQPDVIPTQGDLLGDLLNLDLGPPVSGPPLATSSVQMGAVDLLGGGLDSLVCPGAPSG